MLLSRNTYTGGLLCGEDLSVFDFRNTLEQIYSLLENVRGVVRDYVDWLDTVNNLPLWLTSLQDIGSSLEDLCVKIEAYFDTINDRISGIFGFRLINGDSQASVAIYRLWRALASGRVLKDTTEIQILFQSIPGVLEKYGADIPEDLARTLDIISEHGENHTQVLFDTLNWEKGDGPTFIIIYDE